MKQKRIFTDLGFWMLLGINVYLVYYYYQHPEIFTTLIWLYWCQSVLVGIFNFLDILTVRTIKVLPDDNDPQGSSLFRSRLGCGFFFLVHYGFFHIGYMLFIAGIKRSGPFQFSFFKYFLIAFFVGQVITFIQHKVQQRTEPANLRRMFFLPYLRIVPMHLTILLPAFMHITQFGIFLILKAIADVTMYILTKPAGNTKAGDQALLASHQNMNI